MAGILLRSMMSVALVAGVLTGMFAPAAEAQTAGGYGPLQISWEVRNRFRLFREERDFLLHAETGRGRSVLAAEQALAIHGGDWDHFIVDVELEVSHGRAAGLLFRCDRGLEVLNWLRLDFTRQVIELQKQVVFDSGVNRFKLRKTLVQSAPVKLLHGRRIHIRLLACREYIEVSIDGVVRISAVTYAAQRGSFGVFVESGAGCVTPPRLQPLRTPD